MLLKVVLISLVVATIEQRHTRGRFRGGTVPSATPSPVTPAPTTFATPATPNIISSVGITASTLTKMETVRSDPDAMEEPVNNTTSMVAMNEDDDTVTPAVTNNNNTGGTSALDDTSGELLELEMDIPEEEEMNGTSATLLTLAAMTSQGQETVNNGSGQYNNSMEEKQTTPHPEVVPKGDPSGRNWTKFSIDFPGNCV